MITGIVLVFACYGSFVCGQDTVQIDRLNSTSFDLIKTDPDSAEALAREAIRLAEPRNYLMGLGDAYVRLGILEKDAGNYNQAVAYYKKSLEYRLKIGNRDLVARVYNNIGAAFTKQARYDSAAFYLLQALREAEALGLNAAQAMYSMNLGIAYENNGDYDLALKYNQLATDRYREEEDSLGLLKCMINRAAVYYAQQDYVHALPMYRDAVAWAGDLENDREKYLAVGGLALVYMDMHRPDSALYFLRQALEYQLESENLPAAAIDMSNMGILFNQMHRPDSALIYFTRSLDMAEAVGDIRLAATNTAELSALYRAKGDFRNGFLFQEKYIAYHDSVFSESKSEAIADMQTRYETEKKESEIRLLNKDREIQQQQLARKTLLQQALIGGIVLILLITALFFNRYKLKKRIEQQQALLTERKRISSELHDDLGAQLSTAKLFLSRLKEENAYSGQQQILENSLNLIDGSISDLRRIMDDLQASTLQEKGLIAAIEELVNRINQLQDIRFELSHHGLEPRLDPKLEHQLFRITQELVNNTLKYAGASHVTIDFTARDGTVVLMFEDNGKGFDPQKVRRGYGLSNIESRARSLAGSATFDSRPGAGSTTTIEIPLHHGATKT